MDNLLELLIITIFFISFYGLLASRNIIKSIVFIVIMETAVILFFLSLGYTSRVVPPVAVDPEFMEYVADPLPQALMITAVIVGLATTAVNITIFITLFRKHKSADWDTVKMQNAENA